MNDEELRARVAERLAKIAETQDDGVYAKAYAVDVPALLALLDTKSKQLDIARTAHRDILRDCDAFLSDD